MIRRAKALAWLILAGVLWVCPPGSCPVAMAAGRDAVLHVWTLEPASLLWEVALPGDGRFCLGHVNSIYEAPVRECFQARPGGGCWLVEVQSPSPAVFEYYGLEPPVTGRAVLRRPLGDFQVRSHDYSRHHLTVGDRTLRLDQLAQPGQALVFKVASTP
ncbi:MAG: hypothetical protein HY910_05450 [Desulfarculus sp.]|nr:hypothetical protein [Desulfarculus sp.]